MCECPPPPAPGLTECLQHHQLDTPTSSPLGPLTPRRDLEYPPPSCQTPTNKEERTIAQKNQDFINATDNLRYLGLHLVSTPSAVVVNSISITKSNNGLVPRDPSGAPRVKNAGSILKSRAESEPGTETGWDQGHSGIWSRRNVSDPGVEMPDISRRKSTRSFATRRSWPGSTRRSRTRIS